jgi:phage N-6-adenine-methyltransferase
MVGNELTGPVAGIVYKAESADEADIITHCKKAMRQADRSSWDVADDYYKLSKRGWTQQRIAEEFGVSQASVSKFIACASEYSLANNRPPFWEAYQRKDGKAADMPDKQCKTSEWYTPPEILEPVRDYFGGAIPLDPAAPLDNPTGAERFFTKQDNGLTQDWAGNGAFVNPPYGAEISDWCRKIHESASTGLQILALLPCGARFSTSYCQNYILNEHLTAICFVRGRVGFVNEDGEQQTGNIYDSAIYGYNADHEAFARSFDSLGKVACVKGRDALTLLADTDSEPSFLPRAARNTGEEQWYTPPKVVEAVRAVMGDIDLDPASCETAQEIVRAKRYFTREDDALKQEWKGKVFMNPPYTRGVIDELIRRLVAHYRAGLVPEAIVLTNNASDTNWFHELGDESRLICLVKGRIRFQNPSGTPGGPTQGQALFYLGGDDVRFAAVFKEFGLILKDVNERDGT